jgi:hypothetical protein
VIAKVTVVKIANYGTSVCGDVTAATSGVVCGDVAAVTSPQTDVF